jgi:hypothetical protein
MHQLKRITIDYLAAEDRLRLSGEGDDGGRLAIWLTRRLLDRLVPVLLDWMQREGCDLPMARAGDAVATNAPAPRAEPLHSFAQQAARASLSPVVPVQVTATDQAWLAQAVDVGRATGVLRLTFRGADVQQAVLTLRPQPLRQWLNILHDAYRKADWPATVWPDWVRDAAPTTSHPRPVQH